MFDFKSTGNFNDSNLPAKQDYIDAFNSGMGGFSFEPAEMFPPAMQKQLAQDAFRSNIFCAHVIQSMPLQDDKKDIFTIFMLGGYTPAQQETLGLTKAGEAFAKGLEVWSTAPAQYVALSQSPMFSNDERLFMQLGVMQRAYQAFASMEMYSDLQVQGRMPADAFASTAKQTHDNMQKLVDASAAISASGFPAKLITDMRDKVGQMLAPSAAKTIKRPKFRL